MKKMSAGILLFRRTSGAPEVLLVHPGGPFWAKRDAGAWTIPKGLVEPGEDVYAAARREFREETGFALGEQCLPLTPRPQAGGKIVHAWAIEGDCDALACRSNEFTLEWPPRSGRSASFPEIDRAQWFALDEARGRILPGQAPFLDELERRLAAPDQSA